MFDQFREKFQAVQQDLSDGIKNLGAKSNKSNRGADTFKYHDSIPSLRDGLHVSAGADLMNRFQEHWAKIHEDLESSANKATEVDGTIERIARAQEKQLAEWQGIKKQLQDIPQLLKDIQSITAKIGKLAADFEEAEASLIQLNDVMEEEDHHRNKEMQRQELENYKKQKLYEESLLKARLQDEFSEKLQAKQKEEDVKMRERQQAFQEFFVADLNHYKEFGQMHRSMDVTSHETPAEDLEIEWNEDDQQALDDFLGPSDEEGVSGEEGKVEPVVEEEEELETPAIEDEETDNTDEETAQSPSEEVDIPKKGSPAEVESVPIEKDSDLESSTEETKHPDGAENGVTCQEPEIGETKSRTDQKIGEQHTALDDNIPTEDSDEFEDAVE